MNPSGKTILIVEDNDDIRSSLVEALEMEGYDVIAVADGQQGIDALQQHPKIHLIVLDLSMPVKDGYSFRLEQQADPRWKHIPVVVMTADTNAIRRMEQ